MYMCVCVCVCVHLCTPMGTFICIHTSKVGSVQIVGTFSSPHKKVLINTL